MPARFEALLQAERLLVAEPADFRERVLRRARESLGQPFAQDLPAAKRPTWVVATAAAVVVLAVGAAVYRARESRPGPIPSVLENPVTTAAEPRSNEQISAVELIPPPVTTMVAAPAPPPTKASEAQSAADELRLLEPARRALANEAFASAWTALSNHERRFPAGRLAEEREALKVTALLGMNRREEARHTASAFRKRFPHSVLLARMEDILREP
jgi:hypothetical protein